MAHLSKLGNPMINSQLLMVYTVDTSPFPMILGTLCEFTTFIWQTQSKTNIYDHLCDITDINRIITIYIIIYTHIYIHMIHYFQANLPDLPPWTSPEKCPHLQRWDCHPGALQRNPPETRCRFHPPVPKPTGREWFCGSLFMCGLHTEFKISWWIWKTLVNRCISILKFHSKQTWPQLYNL